MRPKQRKIILILVVVLIIFSFFVYFSWQPDSLIDFVPENSFLYLHIDLNQARRSGCLGNQWLNNPQTQQTLKGLAEDNANLDLIKNVFKKENLSLLDEVGLVVLFPQDYIYQETESLLSKAEIILFLKIKRWSNLSLLIKSLKQFHLQELEDHIWVVSDRAFSNNFQRSNVLLVQESLSKRDPLFSKLNSLVWAKGYFNFVSLTEILKTQQDLNWSKSGLAEVKISSPSEPENLFFSLDLTGQENKPLFSLFENFVFNNRPGPGFVFIIPQVDSIDFLKQRIKIALSVQEPIKKQVILPDQSKFIELIADPDNFNFKTQEFEQIQLHYWPDNYFETEESMGIFIWQDQGHTFVANKFSLFKEITKNFNILLSGIENQGFEKGIFFQINNRQIRDLIIIKTGEEIKGRLGLDFQTIQRPELLD